MQQIRFLKINKEKYKFSKESYVIMSQQQYDKPMDEIQFNGWRFLSYKNALGTLFIQIFNGMADLGKITIGEENVVTAVCSYLAERDNSPTSNSKDKFYRWLNQQSLRCKV